MDKTKKIILQEIQHLHQAHIIDTATMQRIEAYYVSQKSKNLFSSHTLLVVFGTILIGLGIISLLAVGWNDLSRPLRVFIALLPFLVGSSIGGLSLYKNYAPWIKECACIFSVIGVITALVIPGQIYHVVFSSDVYFLQISLLIMPLVYFYRSSLTALVYLFVATTALVLGDSSSALLTLLKGIGLLLLIVPYLIQRYKESPTGTHFGWCSVAFAISVFALLTSTSTYNVVLREVYLAYFILLMGLGRLLYPVSLSPRQTPAPLLGTLGFYITLFILCITPVWDYFPTLVIKEDVAALVIMAVATLFAVVVSFITYRQHKSLQDKLLLFCSGILTLLFISTLGPPAEWFGLVFLVFFNLLFLALAIYQLILGLNLERPLLANLGLLMLGGLTLIRFVDVDISFMTKGILFISFGIATILLNLYVLRKKSRNDDLSKGGTPNEK